MFYIILIVFILIITAVITLKTMESFRKKTDNKKLIWPLFVVNILYWGMFAAGTIGTSLGCLHNNDGCGYRPYVLIFIILNFFTILLSLLNWHTTKKGKYLTIAILTLIVSGGLFYLASPEIYRNFF